jgi:uncharacterized membrane protein YkoI
MTRWFLVLLGLALTFGDAPFSARAAEADSSRAPKAEVDSRAPKAETDPRAPKTVCLTPAETREEIKARKLVEPFAALKSAQAQYKGEPVSAKLCRIGDEYVYEIALLHRDGRYVHVTMNAETGKWLEPRHGHDAAPKT